MSSHKCPQCGLVNFANAVSCKRCQTSLSGVSSESTFTPRSSASIRNVSQTSPVQISFVSVIKNDYGAFMGLIMPFVVWGIFIATNVFGFSFSRRGRSVPADGSDPIFLYIALGGTVLGIALLVWRVRSFQQVFANGKIAVGRITNISFFKDRGRIEYSYGVNGQTYQSGNAIMKNRKTRSFQDGDEIELIIDSSNPKRAFVKALYV